jgi:hypothetical protein
MATVNCFEFNKPRFQDVTHRVLLQQLGFFFFLNVGSNFSHFETYLYLASSEKSVNVDFLLIP